MSRERVCSEVIPDLIAQLKARKVDADRLFAVLSAVQAIEAQAERNRTQAAQALAASKAEIGELC